MNVFSKAFDMLLTHNRFSKFYPIWGLIGNGIHKTCLVSIYRIFIKLVVILSLNTLGPMSSDSWESFLCIVINIMEQQRTFHSVDEKLA
jgi:hypothetical protein